VVVTAAHCLVFPWDRKPIPAKDIHFVAGIHKDEQAGHATASCTLFAPGALQATAKYNPDLPVQTVPLDAFIDDIAVIVLHDDISVEPVPPATDDVFEAGLPLAHVAYPANKRYRLMADQSCMLLERQRGVWFTTCDTYPASSGGPVFVTSGGKTKVAAVMLGHGENFSLAWPVSRWSPFPLDGRCPNE
jgi:V8-like Glu-specific endopeptidase